MDVNIDRIASMCADWIRSSQRVVLLSGAGMSTSAGLPDFRGPNGIIPEKNGSGTGDDLRHRMVQTETSILL